ncbi:hydantoinase/oxoprolinase family protein [Govanella unica]|uniref:Hydantoinase/oxoprolinase family protein n=1 Tax=Govanella unica TaxID=2975056 RepID=A0A9X3TZ00_9PROT|nr:hydantoinase/oxoprolinase family protein [Govania unica]MDA5194398.1 hydantoinase/oxoprolinase family protein [Govania unica]
MRFATDTGGTFTDLVVEEDDGSISMYKASTVPGDPVQGVLAALTLAAEDRGLSLADLLARGKTFIHGTTHAINAIITGRTAKTALLVTEGHRDILVFREGGRIEPFNHTVPYPKPFVPRALTFEIPERIIYNGAVQTPLNEAVVLELANRLREEKIEAVAICFLWSTINPAHELRVGALLQDHLPGVPVSLSHAVNPTMREFRRASSTAIDASLKPLMGRYLGSLEARMKEAGFAGEVMVLTSAGGMMAASDVAAAPIRVINSGPSMAPIAGHHYAALEGSHENAIVADTGGTTYDISLVRGGHIPMTRELWIGQPTRGNLVGYPSVEVKSVGAGGGSIASVDAGGLLHVGPMSAGAQPGPVCYGRGGTLPTVTDASVVLGYLDPDFFLGGAMKLDREAAARAIEIHVAQPLQVSVEEAAWNIIHLSTENMVQAIADITVAQGIDPAGAVLIGGGGAAGLNSTFIARRLGCHQLVIPETGAALSAAGAMMSDLTGEFAASLFTTTAEFNFDKVNETLYNLRADCDQFVRRSGIKAIKIDIKVIAEARYENQVWDIDVPLPITRFRSDDDVTAFHSAFDEVHKQIFTINDPGSPVEVVGLRATVRCKVRPHANFQLSAKADQTVKAATRRAYFQDAGWTDAVIHRLDAMPVAQEFRGPAIIESPFTTIVVDPEARAQRSANGSIIIHP